MRILHTADWHLGARLDGHSREEEHTKVLEWLADLLVREQVDLLIIAGDIFDTFSPPNYAQKLYYSFLRRLINTSCHHIVVVAGNHDSAHFLEAPRELLRELNVYVVGNPSADIREQIVPIYHPETKQLQAVVGAVPYLTETYLRKSQPAQSLEARLEQLRTGIASHYEQIGGLLSAYADQQVPLITTGHLFVAGGERGGRKNLIHLGCLDVISPEIFEQGFDYVALGHLHHPHSVGGRHIRYSGSLIPLDFSEINHNRRVYMIDFEGRNIQQIHKIDNPVARTLLLWKGGLEEVRQKFEQFVPASNIFKTWVRIELLTDSVYDPVLKTTIQEWAKGKFLEILGEPRQINPRRRARVEEEAEDTQEKSLEEIPVEDIFKLCALSHQPNEQDLNKLIHTFSELREWMDEEARKQTS
jgi:DNA repair protein SbcD/Mre11